MSGLFADRRRLAEALCVAVPVAVFLALALYHLTLPGLYYDEAADAIPALDLLQRRQPELVRPHGFTLLGRTWPLMAFDYVGAVHTYAALPFFALLGPGVVALRLMTVLGAAATVALTYLWVRWLFGSRWVATAAALLLAAQPSWVFYARQGVHVSSLMALWLMAALVLLVVWRRTGATRWLAGAAFLLGLGLSTKLLFLWVDLALLAIYLLWRGPAAYRLLRAEGAAAMRHLASRAPQCAAVTAAFLAGSAPIIVYNLQTNATLAAIGKNAAVTPYGVRNADYLANLGARLDTLWALLDGGHFWFLGGLYGNPLFPVAVAAAAVWLITRLRRQERPLVADATCCGTHARPVRTPTGSPEGLPPLWQGVWGVSPQFPKLPGWAGGKNQPRVFNPFHSKCHRPPGVALLLGLVLLVLVQSPFTVSGIWPTHLFVLLPLLTAIPAVALGWLWRRGQQGAVLASAAVALLLAGNLYADAQYHAALVRTGGHRGHSDAVYTLAAYLDEHGVPAPLAMDWGIGYPVQLVTQGRVRPVEVFGYTPEPGPAFAASLPLADPAQRYLFHGDDYTAFPRFEALRQAAAQAGKQVRLQQTFYERSGTPVYLVYSVE